MICDECNRPDILPVNADAVSLFMAAGTQWRFGPAGAAGLDYTGLRSTADWLGMEATAELLDKVQTMEGQALKLLRDPKRGDH